MTPPLRGRIAFSLKNVYGAWKALFTTTGRKTGGYTIDTGKEVSTLLFTAITTGFVLMLKRTEYSLPNDEQE